MTDGVLGVGDSITASCGFPAGNLPLASWAQWVARALGESVDLRARPGASTAEVLREVIGEPDGRYRLGLVYLGTNDILRGTPTAEFAEAFGDVLDRVGSVAEMVLTLTPPLWVGRVPTVAPYGHRLRRVYAVGAAIRAAAGTRGVVVAQAPELHGPRYVAGDRVHPTAAGQVAFADAAAWALRDRGWVLPLPSELAGNPDPVTIRERNEWTRATARAAWEAPARSLVRALR